MRIRTFLIIVLVLAVVFAVVYTMQSNAELIQQEFKLFGGVSLGMGWMLFWAFAAGVAITGFVGLAREMGLMIERWRLRRQSRTSEEIEDEYSRGLVADMEGRDEEALRHFRAVLERDSRHFNTLIKLGEVQRDQGRYADAIEVHRKAHHLKPDDTRPLYALADDHEAKGDMDRARAVVGKIIGLNKTSLAPWRKLRSLHEKEKNWEKALEAQHRIEKLAQAGTGALDDADRRFGLGIRYEIASKQLEEGKTKEAIAGFRRVLKDNRTFIPAHRGLGEALSMAGQDDDALDAWHGGFEATGSPVFLTLLEEHFLRQEQPLGAIEALKQSISRARKDTLARFFLGKLYFRLEMLDDALSVLSSLEGRAAYAPTLHYLLGRIHERRGNHGEAASAYRRVIKETNLIELDYGCRVCDGTRFEWTARCPQCDEWNTIEVNFREEISAEELGLAPAPIYSSSG